MNEDLTRALELIDRILSQGQIKIGGEALTRVDHVAISNAFQMIAQACQPTEGVPSSNGKAAKVPA